VSYQPGVAVADADITTPPLNGNTELCLRFRRAGWTGKFLPRARTR
jgi:hypothetical protein